MKTLKKTPVYYMLWLILISNFTLLKTNAQTLDNSFGTNGKVFTSFGAFNTYFYEMAVLPNGNIYSVGAKEGAFFETNGIFISRHLPDGSLDTSFDNDGKIEVGYGSNYEFCHTTTIQPDEKLLIAGSSNGSFSMARLNTNGTYDNDFSGDGKLIFSFGAGIGSKINKILLQPDGKIIAIGQAYNGTDYDFGMARFNTDGSVDTTFGTNGKTNVNIGPANDFGRAAVLQTDGKIIICGYSNNSSGDSFSIIRLNNDGSLDTNFGTNGKIYYNIPTKNYCVAESIVLQSDGKIVLAGHADGDFALLRYNTNGTLDTTFGNLGYTITDFANSQDKSYAIAIQNGNKIILGGHGFETGNTGLFHAAMARYDTNGNLDTTFSSDGKMVLSMAIYNDGIESMYIQPDGKMLFGGYSQADNSSSTEYVLFRLNTTTLSTSESFLDQSQIKIFPNPTNSNITVDIKEELINSNIFITNLQGQTLRQSKLSSIIESIDLSELASGIYILTLQKEDKRYSQKIIKN